RLLAAAERGRRRAVKHLWGRLSYWMRLLLWQREKQACRGRMCVLLPVHVGDGRLRNTDAATDMNRLALGSHGAHFVVQCTDEVYFELQRRVSNAPREHRMDRASERGIEQRAEVAAMHAAERIVITPVRGALKYDTSGLCGDRNKAKRFTD